MTIELILGLVTGIFFGVFLQQGQVLRFEKQVGAMLFQDMTILKFMLSAILVGMIGIQLLVGLGWVTMDVKTTILAANIVGGLLFGIGWAWAGFCPGTSVGAVGEGRVHALWVILGMLAGAAIYAEVFPLLSNNLLAWGDFGKITLPQILGISPWFVIGALALVYVGLFALFEKLGI
jgi:hypothetical protein